jgi:hypothetical protein
MQGKLVFGVVVQAHRYATSNAHAWHATVRHKGHAVGVVTAPTANAAQRKALALAARVLRQLTK